MRRLVLLVAILAALFATAPGADAVVPLTPADNANTTSTPTFSWQLDPGEEAFVLELSPNPAPGEGGGFTDDMARRIASLDKTQTSYAVGNGSPLSPGAWYWHVNAFGPFFDSRWTPVRRIFVPDDPIRLLSFRLTDYPCLRQLAVEFKYEDNSVGRPASYRLEFRRSRRGRIVTHVGGRAQDGQEFRALRIPRRLRRGRYYVRLRLRDAGNHVASSRFRRISVGRC